VALGTGQGWSADTVIDATGKYVIPGGVDGHTHMEMPFGGTVAADTFETGTRAAAWGGTTTIVDFAIQSMGATLREGLDAWHAKAEGNCAIDYGFHMIMADVNEGSLKEMEGLVGEGITSFKLFMAYPGVLYSDDGQVLRALQKGAETGGLILMHAENGIAIDVLIEQALARGQTDPRYHGIVRHELLEAEATHRAIKLAQVANAPVYIVHLSAEKALAEVTKARDEGYNAFAETCPQYLFLSMDDLGNGFEGAKFVCSPPLRTADHQPELWTGLIKDDLQVVSTDHCPFDFHGQKDLGKGDFRKIPNGLPGVEDRIDLLHDGGVVGGRISRERWVEIIATAPARLFGMYPRKGTIAVGSDADIVVYDPERKRKISAKTHHMDVDYSCYEGREVQGASDVVLSRGSVIVRNGEFTGRKGHGQFVKRGTADFARLA
jgi:dihydropyrimidinase